MDTPVHNSSFKRLSHSQRSRPPRTLPEVKQKLSKLVNDKADIVEPIREILKGLKPEQDDISKEVFLFAFKQLNSDELINSKAKELIGILLSEVDKLSGASLVELAEFLIEGVKSGVVANGRSLEVFPKILASIGTQSSITTQKNKENGSSTLSGTDWKGILINSFFSCKWSSSCVSQIVIVSRDLILDQEELKFLIEKLFRVTKTLPVTELPPLVYQLLLLSSHGHHNLILTGMRNLFDELEVDPPTNENAKNDLMEVGTSREEVLRSKGTILLHMDFALKQNQVLSKEFLKSLKVTASIFCPSNYTPFTLSLALSQSLIHRLEDSITDNLKAIIVRCFKEKEMAFTSQWMEELSCHRPVPDIEKIFLYIVDNSVHGWDQVMQGLINLPFSLLDTYSPKSSNTIYQITPNNKACLLGGKILIAAFKSQSFVRSEVLTQLTTRILSSASVYGDHYVSILAEMTRHTPQVLMDIGSQLKEVFSYVMYIPPASAVSVVKAILPLIQFHSSYRDSLLMILKKSLFLKEVECRCAAVGSALLLLKNFKVLDSRSVVGAGSNNSDDMSQYAYHSQSQTLAEVYTTPSSSSQSRSMSANESLCLEILSMLRCSLTQQDSVRLLLYKEMAEVFITNTKLAQPILTLLMDQFEIYYEPDETVVPPLKLSSCLSVVEELHIRLEPLSRLIFCLQFCAKQCIEWVEKGVEPVSCLDKLKKVLASLTRRFSSCELEDFELDKSGEYVLGSTVGSKNHLIAVIIMEIYETLLEYTFTTGHLSSEACQLSLKLYTKYQAISDVLTEKGGSSKKNFVRSCFLSSSTILMFLKSLFNDTLPSHQLPLKVLRESSQFVRYILTATLTRIKESPSEATPWIWDTSTSHESKSSVTNYHFLSSVARVLYNQLDGPSLQFTSGKKDKSKNISSLCLEAFSEICHMIVMCYPKHLISFAKVISEERDQRDDEEEEEREEEGEDIDENEQLHIVIRQFQKLVTQTIGRAAGSDKEYSMKDVHFMITVISTLTERLERSSTQCVQVLEWLDDTCKKYNPDDILLCKELVSFLLSLCFRVNSKNCIKIVRKLAQDIHYHLGDMDEEIELSGSGCYSIVNPRTAPSSVLGPLQGHIDLILQTSEVVINFVKTKDDNIVTDASFSTDSIETQCKDVCDKLTRLVLTFHELTQSAISPGIPTDTLMKNLARFYAILSSITKLQFSLYSKTSYLLPPFKKLADTVGTHLSQQVYHFMLYIHRTQQNMAEEGMSKKGKDKTKSVGKAQLKREKRSIPNLIYQMELSENLLIKLSKKSKCNLMATFKRSVARDFRIKDATLNALLSEQNEGEEEEEEEEVKEEEGRDGQSSRSSGSPKPKRHKTNK